MKIVALKIDVIVMLKILFEDLALSTNHTEWLQGRLSLSSFQRW